LGHSEAAAVEVAALAVPSGRYALQLLDPAGEVSFAAGLALAPVFQ